MLYEWGTCHTNISNTARNPEKCALILYSWYNITVLHDIVLNTLRKYYGLQRICRETHAKNPAYYFSDAQEICKNADCILPICLASWISIQIFLWGKQLLYYLWKIKVAYGSVKHAILFVQFCHNMNLRKWNLWGLLFLGPGFSMGLKQPYLSC